jgi:hypothetical protein
MILVTGGTGLVGCHLLYLLVNKNKKIKALHRKNSKIDVVKKVFSYHSDSFEELFQKIQWVEGDINDTESNTTFEGGVWKTIKIPIRPTAETGLDKTGVNLIIIERIKSSNVTELHIDNLYFYKE